MFLLYFKFSCCFRDLQKQVFLGMLTMVHTLKEVELLYLIFMQFLDMQEKLELMKGSTV